MTLDTVSLRSAFAIVALILLVMFYTQTYRSTRAAYCGWWCLALALFLLGTGGYLLNGTDQQRWANPLANSLSILGVACAWAGARSLRLPPPKAWQILFLPVLTGVLSLFDHPATNVWSGGYIFLFSMSAMFALAAVELWRLERSYTRVQLPLAFVAGLSSAYYFCRFLVYLQQGPDGPVFTAYLGTESTTLFNVILLIAVSFSMSTLSNEQATRDLASRATRDGLTGLLNRSEFLRLAARVLRTTKSSHSCLILADLDHFKDINDSYGHAAGDEVLRQFAAACLGAVRSSDLVGRFGGEEFIFLLPRTTPERAEDIAESINQRLRSAPGRSAVPLPTASYGIAGIGPRGSLDEAIAAADEALYRAKELGRDRISHSRPASPQPG